MILQKEPIRAKDVWIDRSIPDVWAEKITDKKHPHQKPIELIKRLLKSVVKKGGLVLDPAAGSYQVLDACRELGLDFIGAE
jgi:site-specific DNA-methyltransferase (adenine-specific)